MSFGFGFGFPSWRTLAGGFSPAALFVGGVQGAWYDPSDPSTLFTTSAGTTQCAMPGQGAPVPVGLMLDKSQGLVLGSELAGSILGGTSGWTFVGAATVSGGAIVFTTPPSTNASAQYNPILTSGSWYRVQITLTGTGQVTVQLGSAGTSATFTAPGSYSFTGIASGGTPTVLTFSSVLSGVNNFVGSVTAVSVRTLPGNHAIAFNDTTARPELRARVNLLSQSEDFTQWSISGATVTPNTTLAPNNTLTADTISVNANSLGVYQTVNAPAADYTWSVYVNGVAGTVINVGCNSGTTSYQQVTLTGSWQRVFGQVTSNGTINFHFRSDFPVPAGQVGAFTCFAWGADLRPANIGANVPAYQRIADANTYDTSGFPLYLFFDGIDDSMYTPANLNLSGTDKATVFAGVRKLSDASLAIAELSADVNSNNGAFGLFNGFPTASDIQWASKGTSVGAANFSVTAPITRVVTGIGDIPGDVAQLRLNGTQVATSATDQGTGNFGTYPLYIGARNNSSLWFNGHLYSLIIAGSAVSAGNISATEQWVAGKTGIQI